MTCAGCSGEQWKMVGFEMFLVIYRMNWCETCGGLRRIWRREV
jgi:hypothetical protein